MQLDKTDILICGGGPAGLIAAAALAHAGFNLCVVDPSAPITKGDERGADLRSTAFLQPAQALFREIGIWDRLLPHAIPLDKLRIVDTAGDPPELRDERAFDSAELGDQPFGWNFLNWRIRHELVAHLTAQPNVELRFGTGFASLLTRTSGAIVTLTDGTRLQARMVVAADGRNSPVRDASGIAVKTTRYGQKALAFIATHPEPHLNVSTEIYHEGGPFTMVPLADIDGIPASAIVWMNPGRRAVDLAALPESAFNVEMSRRSAGLFGPLELASPRALWPIITQRAEALTAQRIALIAEAAHVLPPIGAQGLNTSLNDVAALLEAARGTPAQLGEPPMLATYEKARHKDIANRTRIIDLFNRVTRSGDVNLQSLRLAGLKAAHDIAPLRQGLMRAGMGPL
ncbi:MAG: FAD-dependent monooxygenase [Marinosulfonomonas sp.]